MMRYRVVNSAMGAATLACVWAATIPDSRPPVVVAWLFSALMAPAIIHWAFHPNGTTP